MSFFFIAQYFSTQQLTGHGSKFKVECLLLAKEVYILVL
jgi:hypothetical protein